MSVVTTEVVEVRCPLGAKTLLAKVLAEKGGTARRTTENLLELSCRSCTRQARHEMADVGMSTGFRILHRYDFAGQFVESVREPLS